MVNLPAAKMEEKVAKRILCIEDEPEMIDLIRLILGRRGFDVSGAAGGTAGIKAAARAIARSRVARLDDARHGRLGSIPTNEGE